jgi:hypothetical protein
MWVSRKEYMFTYIIETLRIRNTLSIKALEKLDLETIFQEHYLSEQAITLLPTLVVRKVDGHQCVEFIGIPLRSIAVMTKYLNAVAIVLAHIQELYALHIDASRVESFMVALLKDVSIPGYFVDKTHLKKYLKQVLSASIKLVVKGQKI